jgi:cardiolipin synthase
LTVAGRSRALRSGHALALLRGGQALFPAMVRAIDAARDEVLVETYMLHCAGSVLPVIEALEQAARRGVRVQLVVDGVGTGELPAEWAQRWSRAGVQWREFNPARGWRLLLPQGWRRLHRKLCVVDATVGFCGGINLIDDRVDPSHGALAQPRFDFAVRVTGPLVSDMRDTMLRLWTRLQVGVHARQGDVAGVARAVRVAREAGTDMADTRLGRTAAQELSTLQAGATPGLPPGGDATDPGSAPGSRAVLVLRDNLRFRRSIEGHYRLAIGRARREIIIANAYFIPGVRLQQALLRAARRGVRITLLLQGRYEYFMQFHASRAVYRALLAAGIQIFEYQASFLHAKVAVMDADGGLLATVGSSNLDPLSLLLAREANLFMRDDTFAHELRGELLDAIARGHRVEPDTVARWSWPVHVRNWLAYAAMRTALFLTGRRY